MRRTAVLVALVIIAACAGDNVQDLTAELQEAPATAVVKNADSVEIFMNADLFPNLARVCIDGIAILTTTRLTDSVLRVPEWDQHCPKG